MGPFKLSRSSLHIAQLRADAGISSKFVRCSYPELVTSRPLASWWGHSAVRLSGDIFWQNLHRGIRGEEQKRGDKGLE